MAQQVAETLGFVSTKAAQASASASAGIAEQSKLTFPYNLIAMAATGAALVAAGITVFGGGGGGGTAAPVTNTGTGTVLGDSKAKSDSIKNAIDALHQVDTLMLSSSRQMAGYLKSIDSQIGGVAAVLVRSGDVGAGTVQASKPSGILGSLFGTRIDVTGSGLFSGPQSLGSVLGGGLNTQSYSDIVKVKKFLGIVTSKTTSTQYGAADPAVSAQFSLILKSFNDAIVAASGPLGSATKDIQDRLNGFIVNIGKVDLAGLSGTEIQEKLSAVFGAAADQMAAAAFPGMEQFQKVGEGLFETLVRVSSTVETVTAALDQMGGAAPQINDHGTNLKSNNDVVEYGSEAKAQAFALWVAVSRGAIEGISQASQNILKAGRSDIQGAAQKAAMIEQIPVDLKTMLDPVGAAVDAMNRKWKTTVAALKEGGASAEQMAQAQRLWSLQMNQVKNSTSSASQTLKDFVTSLKVGSGPSYSLRDQEGTAKAALQPFIDQINAGTSIDQSKYQQAAQTYLDIERQLYGSTQGWFDALDAVQASTAKAISAIDNAVPITPGVPDPFTKQTATAVQTGNEIADTTNDLLSRQVRQNEEILAALAALGGGGGGFIGAARNFSASA